MSAEVDNLRREKIETDDCDELMQYWQTCVDMANSVSQRRDTMNNLFVTLNIAVVAAISIIWDLKSLLLSLGGVALCILWILFINNYKRLNKAKFEVILEIELRFLYQPFSREWELLKGNKKYKDGTKLELAFPIAFVLIYIASIALIFKSKGGVLCV